MILHLPCLRNATNPLHLQLSPFSFRRLLVFVCYFACHVSVASAAPQAQSKRAVLVNLRPTDGPALSASITRAGLVVEPGELGDRSTRLIVWQPRADLTEPRLKQLAEQVRNGAGLLITLDSHTGG